MSTLDDESTNLPTALEDNVPAKRQRQSSSRSASWIADHIQTLTNGRRRCSYCSTVFSNKTSTGTIGKHLTRYKVAEPKKDSKLHLFQKSIEGFSKPLSDKQITSAIATYVVSCRLSHEHVESTGFLHFIAQILPGSVAPSSTTISRRIMQMYIVLKLLLKRHLCSLKVACSLTFDGWSNQSLRGFYAVTLHWMNEDNACLEEIILDFFHVLPGPGNGKRCDEYLSQLVASLDLIHPLVAIVSDNGSDAVLTATTAITLLKHDDVATTEHIRCFAHTFQLAIRSITDAIAPSVDRLRSHIASMRASKNMRAMFATMSKTFLGKAYNPPTLDTPTRWNSTHTILRDCIRLKQVIVAILSSNSVSVDVDWDAIDDVTLFLEVPAKVSTQLGLSHYCSLPKAVAANTFSIDHCNRNVDRANQIVADTSKSMLQCLIHHARHLTCNDANIAKFLDLRVSRDILSVDFACDRSVIESLLERQTSSEDVGCSSIEAPLDDEDSDINLFGSSQVIPTKVQSELQMFSLHPQLSRDVDVLEWCKTHKYEYPRLYKLAANYLAVPATSVPSERANSSAKHVFDGRPRLSDTMFKAEICVDSWLRFFQKSRFPLPNDYLVAFENLKGSIDLQDLAKDDPVIQQYLDSNK
ncbi:hypothetical protein LEN26_005364 [Aphanomyces euteiches]|nr:hypothetical protein LEN26_005364 [Aphanomyces euteiches]KAH9183359.1 hypothetical protein AeNC1_014665 [Aphanomyces euteiches]